MLLLHLENAIDDNPPVELAANHLFDVCSFVVMNSPSDFQIKLLYSEMEYWKNADYAVVRDLVILNRSVY